MRFEELQGRYSCEQKYLIEGCKKAWLQDMTKASVLMVGKVLVFIGRYDKYIVAECCVRTFELDEDGDWLIKDWDMDHFWCNEYYHHFTSEELPVNFKEFFTMPGFLLDQN